MKPFVSLPDQSASTRCSYAPDIDQPGCGAESVQHLAVRSQGWGLVSLLACADHRGLAANTGEVLAYHPTGELCRLPTGECWS